MKNLLHNIRFYILAGSIILSLAIYLWIMVTVSLGISQTAKLVEDYGLISLIYLYLTLLAGPFCYTFSAFPYRGHYLKARRALGVGAFYFGLLHTAISLFGQLGGFSGLTFLDNKYLFAVVLGFIALFIFSLLTITSFDYAVEKLSFPKWKLLHRFVYLAGILILIHTVMLGTHFSILSNVIPQITFIALAFLFLLEAPRFDKYIDKIIQIPQFGMSFVFVAILLSVIFFTVINPLIPSTSGGVSFDIHAAHRQLAQQALQQSQQNSFGTNNNLNNIPGLSGDRTRRYTVSMSTEPANPEPNQDVTLHFTVYDASSGNKVSLFKILYTKQMHFIIVNSDLTYFTHIHPTEDENGVFSITTQFPKDDLYHLYTEFWPFGGIEQQIGFTLPVGQVPSQLTFSKATPDADKAKTFGDYSVSVYTHGGLTAQEMSLGYQTISFTIKNANTGKLITTLKPYLASFGHLTMIKQNSFDFIHVHPFSLVVPPPNANGGPTVNFLPIGIYGSFKPGVYRAFAEFNPDNQLITADFTIRVN
jgi:DMSO/TMAO reductase YedYZ heme-binding membrane subunit